MQAVLDAILQRLITIGRLTVVWPDGSYTVYAGEAGPGAALRIRDKRTIRRLVLHPALALGEAYTSGDIVVESGVVYDLLETVLLNLQSKPDSHPVLRFRETLNAITRHVARTSPVRGRRRHLAHNYDLNGRLYSLFLDRDRQYSCAYFPTGRESLEEAQAAKRRHIAAKLCLHRPGLDVLDIGSGWGGTALALARDHGARVTGITLSQEQLAESRARAAAEGLTDRVRFELLDYRALQGRFDRIVSVGMFEHVGVGYYRDFFGVVKNCLAPDGIALLHSIGCSHGPYGTNPWLAKYIFPGGYCPALSEVLPAIEKAGLFTTDIEILRLHYAETLRHWRRRFAANRDAIAALYDERFCRMFEFYLSGAELSFRREGQMVFQIQMARDQAAVPLTRDYIMAAERGATAQAPVSA